MIQTRAVILSTLEVMPETFLLRLEAPDITLAARPGQFVMVRGGGDTVLPRPFSIHRTEGGRLSLLFAAVGTGTRWLAQRKRGETIDIFGPLGNGFTILPDSKNLLLVAGGLGIAPLVFLAETAAGAGGKVTLIVAAPSSVHLLPHGHLTHGLLTDGVLPWNITIHKVTDDGSEGFKGLATDLMIDKELLDQADQVCACGPLPMYRTMAQMPELKGKNVQVSLEIVMGCGTGVCYGCTIRTQSGLKQVCRDGPVFDMAEIIWEEMKGV